MRGARTTSKTCRRPISAVQSFFSTLTQISPALETFGWKIFVMKKPAVQMRHGVVSQARTGITSQYVTGCVLRTHDVTYMYNLSAAHTRYVPRRSQPNAIAATA